jgi:hypothetical protein
MMSHAVANVPPGDPWDFIHGWLIRTPELKYSVRRGFETWNQESKDSWNRVGACADPIQTEVSTEY